jgi:hypothetical protein
MILNKLPITILEMLKELLVFEKILLRFAINNILEVQLMRKNKIINGIKKV